jgi:hypothetical protein
MQDRREFFGVAAAGLACLAASPSAGRQPRPLSRSTVDGWEPCRMADLRRGDLWKFDDGDGTVWQAAGEPEVRDGGVWLVMSRETGLTA